MSNVHELAAQIDAERVRRLGALSRADARMRIESRSPRWRVHRILATDDYGVLAGAKGVGKTFALLDLGVGVALGEPWFGRFETEQATVLVLTSEDSEARLWRRIDAVAASLGREPSDLEGRLYVHPTTFSAERDLERLVTELEAVEPGLVLLDPAYRYMAGVRAQLFDMGAVLTPLQEACSAVGAPLIVGHHFNRRNDAEREQRISGAGLLEWARLVITCELRKTDSDDPAVQVLFEITGNSIGPRTFLVRRSVTARDDSPDPELGYRVEVIAEGEDATTRPTWSPTVLMERVSRYLEACPEPASVRNVRDNVRGKAEHLRTALDRLIADEYVQTSVGARNASLHESIRPYRDPSAGGVQS